MAYEVGAAYAFPIKFACALVEKYRFVELGRIPGRQSGALAHYVGVLQAGCLVAGSVKRTFGSHQVNVGQTNERKVGIGKRSRGIDRFHACSGQWN